MDIVKQEDVSDIYLQHLKEYPGKIAIVKNVFVYLFDYLCRSIMQTRNCGQAGHIQPGPGGVLQVHGDQGGVSHYREDSVLSPRGGGVQGEGQGGHHGQVRHGPPGAKQQLQLRCRGGGSEFGQETSRVRGQLPRSVSPTLFHQTEYLG